MGQRVSIMANQLNPFAPSHEPEPPIQENARVRRNRSSRTVAEPVDNTPGAPLSEGFFGTHFLMGGKRFDLTKPDFLFGKNEDLDLLGGPVKFPYGGVSETVSVLNALINIRRDSIRIVKEEIESSTGEKSSVYRIELIYDCDCDCYIQLHFCAREILDGESIKFDMRFPELKPSRKFMCNVGADQTFNEVLFKPHQFDPQKMHYNGGFWFPVIIEMSTQDPSSGFRDQSQITMCVVERSTQSMVLKPVKQKLIMDGIVYLMQDIFGIENREANSERDFECSICKDNESDTVLLPCRHLCICKNCDDSFLHNVSFCPFCRSPVKALLTLDAIRQADTDSNTSKAGQITAINLIEALNGPIVRSETNTLSRASSLSSRSKKSSIAIKNSHIRQDVVNEIFQQRRGSSENTTSSSNDIELQDIVIQDRV